MGSWALGAGLGKVRTHTSFCSLVVLGRYVKVVKGRKGLGKDRGSEQ